MTFYLKYRPQTIEDLDLEDVKITLQKVVRSKDIPHAFLFSGPKGTGKTSAARILAKVINCEKPKETGVPCNQCKTCKAITRGDHIDVIEMDAASHRGIDDIRVLKDAVKLSPASATRKVYIIDEAHMLTTEASNALLKTLEEPPDHVVFIMATTNPEKLIATIRSRTSIVQFQKASILEITTSLEKVVKGEKIKAEKPALELIAEVADGSFRDAQKMLEQLSTELSKLTKENVQKFLFGEKTHDIEKFIDLLIAKDTKNALDIVEKISGSASIKYYTEMLIARFREALLSKYNSKFKDIRTLSVNDLSSLIKLFSDAYTKISYFPIEQLPVELAVVDWCGDPPQGKTVKKGFDEVDEKNTAVSNGKKKIEDSNENVDARFDTAVVSQRIEKVHFPTELPDGVDDAVWSNILTQVRPLNASTEALLRAAKPIEYDGKTLNIGVYYKFHKEKLEGTPHRDLLENVLESVMGTDVRIVCTLTEPPTKQTVQVQEEVVLTESDDEDIIKMAEEVFGA